MANTQKKNQTVEYMNIIETFQNFNNEVLKVLNVPYVPLAEEIPKVPYVPQTETQKAYANIGITLEKQETLVKQVPMFLESVSRKGNEVTLSGIASLATKEPIQVQTSLRSILYLNSKSVRRVHPFGFNAWKNFYELEIGEKVSIKPEYTFFVNVLMHNETKVGYALTFKKLVPLSNKIFEAYLHGETYVTTPNELFPFNMGKTEVQTLNGTMVVNFGFLNGNSGIKLTNAQGIQVGVSYKHLPNSVYTMCAQLKQIVSSEKLQKAGTVTEMAQILESFKGTNF